MKKDHSTVAKNNVNFFIKNIKKGTSVFTICKNRNENFEKALSTWVKYDSIDEIVVVDWNSDIPLKAIVDKYQNGKVVLAEVTETVKFSRSVALNLAARLTSFDKIIRLDADIQLKQDFVKEHPLTEDIFYTGHWKNARNKNELALFGITYVHRKHFFDIHGVSEYLEQYGWEDSDLFNRLEKNNLKRLYVNYDTVYHIEHESRSGYHNAVTEDLKASDAVKSFYTIMVNKRISEDILPWTADCKMLDYDLEVINEKYIKCIPQGPKITIVTKENYEKAERSTLIDTLSWDTLYDPKAVDNPYQKFSNSDLLRMYVILKEEQELKKKYNGFHLLSYYDTSWELGKKLNVFYVLYKNYQNKDISSIHLFVKNREGVVDNLLEAFVRKYPVMKREYTDSPTIEELINYSNEYLIKQKIIILNEYVYFDDSLEQLLPLNLEHKLIALSGRNKTEAGEHLPFLSGGLHNYYSSDSFIYSTPFHPQAYTQFKIEDPYYPVFLIGQLSNTAIDLYNPCYEIRSYKNSRQYDKTAGLSYTEWIQGIESIKQPKYGVVWSKLSSLSTNKKQLFSWNHNNVIIKMNNEDLSLFKNIVKTAELYERNIWIIKDNLSASFQDKLQSISNENVNLIEEKELNTAELYQYEEGKIAELLSNKEQQNIYLEGKILSTLNQYPYINTLSEESTPKISVITPSYNSSKAIDYAIKSVLQQDYENYEHIIVDGGSTDDTVTILKKYPHIKWISEKDEGQSDAMNKGFEMSTGEIIVYLNADDAFLPGIFSKVAEQFKKGSEVVMGKVKVTKEDGSYWINDAQYKHINTIRHWEHQSFCVNPVGYFYLREAQAEIGGYKKENHLTMDLEFLLSLTQKYLITKSDEVFGIFRNYSGTKTVESTSTESVWNDNFFDYVTRQIELLPTELIKEIELLRKQGYLNRAESDEKNKVEESLEIAEACENNIERDEKIQELMGMVEEKNKDINRLNEVLEEKIKNIDELNKNISEKEEQLKELIKNISERNDKINYLYKNAEQREKNIDLLTKTAKEKEQKLEDLMKNLKDNDITISDLYKNIKKKDEKINDLYKKAEEREKKIIHLGEIAKEKENSIISFVQEINEKLKIIDSKENKIEELKSQIKAIETFYEDRITELKYSLKSNELDFLAKNSKIEELTTYIQVLQLKGS